MQESKEHFLALPTTQLGRKSTLLALVGLGSISFAILANSIIDTNHFLRLAVGVVFAISTTAAFILAATSILKCKEKSMIVFLAGVVGLAGMRLVLAELVGLME
jgi:hypothetical protein